MVITGDQCGNYNHRRNHHQITVFQDKCAADHDPYCHVCSVHDDETDEITCPPGDLIECTYCNHSRHIDKCARLPRHVVDTYHKSGKVPGVWACPDCIQAACDGLEIESPFRRAVEEVDSDVDSDPESDEGILFEDDRQAQAADLISNRLFE